MGSRLVCHRLPSVPLFFTLASTSVQFLLYTLAYILCSTHFSVFWAVCPENLVRFVMCECCFPAQEERSPEKQSLFPLKMLLWLPLNCGLLSVVQHAKWHDWFNMSCYFLFQVQTEEGLLWSMELVHLCGISACVEDPEKYMSHASLHG